MAKKRTIFQTLDSVISGNWSLPQEPEAHVNSYDMTNMPNKVLYKTDNKEDYERKKLELKQSRYLRDKWVKVNQDLTVQAFNGINQLKLMYNEADLMDAMPEIGAALDTYADEASLPASDGNVIQVYSKSSRVKSILEDLFVNRLNVQVTSQMIIRGMCKYGNQFMILDVDEKQGVKGWKQLPVFEVERLENGVQSPYGGLPLAAQQNEGDTSTQFIWTNATVGGGTETHFRNWQVAHFRLLNNSMYLPYGCSILNSARRHWRMLSLMEDMMLIYRLERSMERRVYKIFVGGIDDADVQGYVETVANNFKRTPIIDPLTGQVDLRKNILPVHKDTPIPLLDGRTITIEQLAREYENGKDNYVYSIQDKTHKIVPGKVVWCGKNYTAKRLVKITLDDGSHVIMAPEHEVILRDGSIKRADELTLGQSLMPFYRKEEAIYGSKVSRYEMVYDPSIGDYEYTHRLIARAAYPSKGVNETVVHHANFNRFDNTPDNLRWMSWLDHAKLHSTLANDPLIRELRKKTSAESWNNPDLRATRMRKMKVLFPPELWDEIEILVADGTLQTQNQIIDYINNNRLIELMRYNSSKKLSHKGKITKGLLKERLKEKGFNTVAEYFSYIDAKYGVTDRTQRDFERRSKIAKKYGAYKNFGGDWHLRSDADQIMERVKTSLKQWANNDENVNSLKERTAFITETYWPDIVNGILQGLIKTSNDLYHFVNAQIIPRLIADKPLSYFAQQGKIGKKKLTQVVKEKYGVTSFDDFMKKVRKNHKVSKIEYVDGDDVYCMTVVGLEGEDDRHNFAIRSWKENGEVNESGIFVKNCWDQDIFIPTRDPAAPNPIDTLSAGQNLTAMDDIKYVQNKVLTALRVPKSFLNFEEAAGEGKNLALMDVRFTRMVNRVQQAFLMEMTKVATIHLYLMGFEDDLTNFTLAMNNPSTQAEQLEVEVLQKKIDVVRDAVSDPGNGLQVMSLQRALKDVLKWSEKDIKTNLEEIRLEKAIAAELEKTQQIIKKTGIFDTVDRIYGEPGAQYADEQQGAEGAGGGPDGGMPPMGGGGGGPTDFGETMDGMDNAGGDMSGDINGIEGSEPTADMGGGAVEPPMENASVKLDGMLVNESKAFNTLMGKLNDSTPHSTDTKHIRAEVYDKAFVLNEEIDKMLKSLDEFGK